MALKILMLQWFEAPKKYSDGSLIHKLELTKNLANIGVKINVITIGNLDLNNHNITCSRFNHSNKILALFLYFTIGFKLSVTQKFDIIYTRHPVFGFFGLIFKTINNSKLIYEINGIRENSQKRADDHLKHVGLSNKVKMGYGTGKIAVLLDDYVAKNSNAIIAVTPRIATYLRNKCGIYPEKIHVIENGANLDLFKPMESRLCRRELGLDESGKYVCFVGSLSPFHGIEFIINSAAEIIKQVNNMKFIIVGDSLLKSEYIQMAEKKGLLNSFIFYGAVKYEDVPKYINAGDICIAPFTRAIGQYTGLSPLKIFEYLACSKPVVASRFPDLEFIEKNNAGVLVEPENTQELSKAIIKLLKDKKLSEMGKNGMNYVIRYHSWESIAKTTENVCLELLNVKNNPQNLR